MAVSQSPPQVDLLSQLRDIHTPEPVSWWPLAPGWWILLVLFLGLAGWLIYYLLNRKHKKKISLLALEELDSIIRKPPSSKSLAESMQLLRRLLMAKVDQTAFASVPLIKVVEFIQQNQLATISKSSIDLFKNRQYAPSCFISDNEWQLFAEDLTSIINLIETEASNLKSWSSQNFKPVLAGGYAND